MNGSGFILLWCAPGTEGAKVEARWGPYSSPLRIRSAVRGPDSLVNQYEAWMLGPKGGRRRVSVWKAPE